MPLVQITLHQGRSAVDLKAISGCVHASLVESFGMDARDHFQVFNEVAPGRLLFSADYAGGPRSDNFMIIAITSMQRTSEVKEAFYLDLVRRLEQDAATRPEDVFIYVADHLKLEDISFANGVSAAELSKRYQNADQT